MGPAIDLAQPWAVVAGHGAPDLVEQTASSVTFTRARGNEECQDAHLVVPLGETFTCDEALISFDYAIKAAPGEDYAHTPVVMIRFCKGNTCESGAFYAMEDESNGFNRCVRGDTNPVVGLLGPRSISVRASSLTPAFDGKCTAPFDTIDVHFMDASASAAYNRTAVPRTLSNLRVSRANEPRPEPPACPKRKPARIDDPPVTPEPPAAPGEEPRPPYDWVGSMATGYRHCEAPEHDWDFDVTWAPDFHVAYGIGGAAADVRSGFRQNLDLTAGVWAQSHERGLAVTGSFVTGFGAYPTYAGIDIGYARYAPILAGWEATIGPAMRIDPNVAFGGEAKLEAIFFFFRGGMRAIAIAGHESELQLTGFLGAGY